MEALSLPQIDYDFWKEKNSYYSSKKLDNQTIRGIKTVQKTGLLNSVIDDDGNILIKSNADLIEIIVEKIKNFDLVKSSNNELLEIFDLIQAWGGSTGRAPYVRPKGDEWRFRNIEEYANTYREAIKVIINLKSKPLDDASIKKVVELICRLDGVAGPFATKHLLFWSTGLNLEIKLPIYDSKMKLLIRGANKLSSAPNYTEFKKALEHQGRQSNIGSEIIERALFAFSKNYFPNENLEIVKDYSLSKDIEVAENLSKWWNQLKLKDYE